MKCPFCKAIIDDDSHFCDQCGQELHFCPECGQPKRGTECPACGADLVSADEFFKAEKTDKPASAEPQVQPSANPIQEMALVGDGFNLKLKEGIFGRTQGIYPEFASSIYISGTHGELRFQNGQWQIRDLGSRNGTFVNGIRLAPNAWTNINVGDQLKIATTHLSVSNNKTMN